jgi:hypothetical protein
MFRFFWIWGFHGRGYQVFCRMGYNTT